MGHAEELPAFPRAEKRPDGTTAIYFGMSLRDYFAGQALMSMLSSLDKIGPGTPSLAAHQAYRFADAMLAERAKESE